MPVFHTKTIESILDPVAQQVSRLVIIHEEGEAGHEMPDLERPVLAVSKAVANLAKVGREVVTTTEDGILRQDMPLAITKVENAASLLEDASNISKADPYSKTARTKLIEGSRWILQGTSSVLLCFDESEVRKIIKECKKVLDYLSVAEVIDSMEDLVQFVKDLSPCLSKVTREVEKRVEDLTHQVHRESLSKCVDQIKTLAPILICSMKIFIQILTQGGKGSEEVSEMSLLEFQSSSSQSSFASKQGHGLTVCELRTSSFCFEPLILLPTPPHSLKCSEAHHNTEHNTHHNTEHNTYHNTEHNT